MPEFGVATKAIIFNTNSKKYLVLKKSDVEDINPDTFDMPGGRIKFGEKLEEAVRRESKEETGLNVKVEQVFNAWTFIKAERGLQLVGIDFLCVTKQEEIRLSEEHKSFEWKSMEEIVGNGKYPDWLKETIKKADEIRKIYL